MLLTKPLCYWLNLYATNCTSLYAGFRLLLQLMLPTKPLCYLLNLYATNYTSLYAGFRLNLQLLAFDKQVLSVLALLVHMYKYDAAAAAQGKSCFQHLKNDMLYMCVCIYI
jgi:hypothetical protein